MGLQPRSTLFPYTTLFRSADRDYAAAWFGGCGGDVQGQGFAGGAVWGACFRVGELEAVRSEEHTSELQSLTKLVCGLRLEEKRDAGWGGAGGGWHLVLGRP